MAFFGATAAFIGFLDHCEKVTSCSTHLFIIRCHFGSGWAFDGKAGLGYFYESEDLAFECKEYKFVVRDQDVLNGQATCYSSH